MVRSRGSLLPACGARASSRGDRSPRSGRLAGRPDTGNSVHGRPPVYRGENAPGKDGWQRSGQAIGARSPRRSPTPYTARGAWLAGGASTRKRGRESIMLRQIDHLVVLVPDLEAAIQEYRRAGFTVVPGGTHPTGTHNALIGFGDGAYLELLAFYEDNPAHRWHRFRAAGGGSSISASWSRASRRNASDSSERVSLTSWRRGAGRGRMDSRSRGRTRRPRTS